VRDSPSAMRRPSEKIVDEPLLAWLRRPPFRESSRSPPA
jgi:hypothetical protein